MQMQVFSRVPLTQDSARRATRLCSNLNIPNNPVSRNTARETVRCSLECGKSFKTLEINIRVKLFTFIRIINRRFSRIEHTLRRLHLLDSCAIKHTASPICETYLIPGRRLGLKTSASGKIEGDPFTQLFSKSPNWINIIAKPVNTYQVWNRFVGE